MKESDIILASNIVLALYSIGPPSIALLFYKKFPFGYYKQLVYGVGLVAWSVFVFYYLSHTMQTLEGIDMKNDSDKYIQGEVLKNIDLWIFALPALILAVGSNFITQFFFSWDSNQDG